MHLTFELPDTRPTSIMRPILVSMVAVIERFHCSLCVCVCVCVCTWAVEWGWGGGQHIDENDACHVGLKLMTDSHDTGETWRQDPKPHFRLE